MTTPRKLTATALTILGCTAIAPLAASTPALAASHRPGGAPVHASSRCVSAARRRAHRARAHACRLHQRKPHTPKAPKVTPRSPTVPRERHTHASATLVSVAPEAVATAVISAVLATPCQNTELTPEAGNMPLVRVAVLCLINRKRAEDGEAPLKPNTQLEEAAESHCQELIAEDYFAHVSPSGETPVTRIRDTGYIPGPEVGYVIGENLAWGTYQLSTPQAIVAAWIASPPHLANILETQYTETGIALTPAVPASLAEGAPGATYAQEFGVIIH